MKKILLGLIVLSIQLHVIFGMEEKNGTKGHVFSKLNPELQSYVIKEGIQSILNSNSDPIEAVIDASKYLNNATLANKFLLSTKAGLERELKLLAKEKFASEYINFNEEELNQKINEAAKALIFDISNKPNYKQLIVSNVNRNNIVKLIIAGANPNQRGFSNNQIQNLLGLAIRYYDPNLIRLLLLYKANTNEWSNSNTPPLVRTIIAMGLTEEESYEIAKLLISNGANVNSKERINEWSLLQYTAIYKRPELTKLFINHGAKVDVKDRNGKTALDFAEQYGAHEVATILKDALAKQSSIV